VLVALALALLHPGLSEELFYRGLFQRALRGWLRPGSAILAAALLFALLHFPGYYFDRYDQDFWQTLLNLADVAVTGLVWGYGFHRSGGLLPWVAVHALSNFAGL
ncbi:MAG TPA: CPBP family intramembrane glutamic endopeptidase, partial [Anaerolineaceae bacterium]|nr:CPBP family intramembrane glutamic endopeptidase [Anaerolineaceae bacterium]